MAKINTREMKAIPKIAVWILISVFSLVFNVQAQMMHTTKDHIIVVPNDIKWADAPPALPSGAKLAVIEGNPSEAGPFTMRIKFPANYAIKPHFHPVDEHITVLDGALFMGMGDEFVEKTATKIPVGGFGLMNKGTHHYAFTKGETLIQLHGMGPWGITYINPQDDPRNKK